MNTPSLSPEDTKETIGREFGKNQEDTPLSAVSAVITGIALLEAGIDVEAIATADLSTDRDFFDFVLALTLDAHRRHKVVGPTVEQISDALPGAFLLNMAAVTRAIMAATLNEEVPGPVARIAATDERLQRTRAALTDPATLEQTLGVLRTIAAEMQKDTKINGKYRGAQKGGTSDEFPANETDTPNTPLRREQLAAHRESALAALAIANAHAGVVIRTMFQRAVDPVSLRLPPPKA